MGGSRKAWHIVFPAFPFGSNNIPRGLPACSDTESYQERRWIVNFFLHKKHTTNILDFQRKGRKPPPAVPIARQDPQRASLRVLALRYSGTLLYREPHNRYCMIGNILRSPLGSIFRKILQGLRLPL